LERNLRALAIELDDMESFDQQIGAVYQMTLCGWPIQGMLQA